MRTRAPRTGGNSSRASPPRAGPSPFEQTADTRTTDQVRHLLVPLELDEADEARIAVVEEQALAFEADVLLLHVLPPGALKPGMVMPAEAQARTYLDIIAARLRGAAVRADSLVLSGRVGPTIVEQALVYRSSLIIMGAHVRPLLPGLVVGGVTGVVLKTAPCPMLAVRAAQGEPAHSPVRGFYEDAAQAGPLRLRPLGVRTVEVARIIGSVGRAGRLGPDFRPLRAEPADEARFRRILLALERGDALPPVDLYKLGFGYYVLDGHHRVAAARLLGQVEIDANVTEFVPMADAQAARTFAARRAFEHSTGLTGIGAARSETYDQLSGMISDFGRAQGIEDYRGAAQRWYGDVFRPLWERVRQRRLPQYFPGERPADVAARVGAWRDTAQGQDDRADWETDVDRFAAELATTQAPQARGVAD